MEKRIDTFTSNGTWTCPEGVTSVIVEARGAGGSGRANFGGGGGGAYAYSTLSVVPGQTYSIVVGTGVLDQNGGDSYFVDDNTTDTLVLAKGGKSRLNGGAGGLASECIGTYSISGNATLAGSGTRSGGASPEGVPSTITKMFSSSGIGGLNRLFGSGGGSTTSGRSPGANGIVRIQYFAEPEENFPYVKNIETFSLFVASATPQIFTFSSELTSMIEDGDLLVAIAARRASPFLTTTTPGWSTAGQYNDGLSVFTCSVFYKTASVSDNSITISSAGASAYVNIVLYLIKNGSTPIIETKTGSSVNSTFNPVSFSGTINALILKAQVLDFNTLVTGWSNTFGSEYSNVVHLPPGLSSGAVGILCSGVKKITSQETPSGYNHSNEQWLNLTIGIPVSDSGGPNNKDNFLLLM